VSLRASHYECEKCAKAKMVKPASLPQDNKIRTKAVGELLHSDVCGPFSTQDTQGNKYIVTLIDDFSRFVMARAIRNKSDVEQNLQELITLFETMSGCKAINLRCDFGGEYRSKSLISWLRKKGIDTKPTVAYHSQTNAVAERTNRTIVTNIRANLGELPRSLWGLAMSYSVYMRNRLPHIILGGKCPIEIMKKGIDMVAEKERFRPFGQKVYIPTYSEGKLADRATKAILVGYTNTIGTYLVMTENKRVITAKSPRVRTEQGPQIVEITVPVEQQEPPEPQRLQPPELEAQQLQPQDPKSEPQHLEPPESQHPEPPEPQSLQPPKSRHLQSSEL